MALTYEPIATYTLTSATSDITFTSITNAYTDLVISISSISGSTSNPTVCVTFNGDTSVSYSGTQFYWRSSGTAGGNKNIDGSFISLQRAPGLHAVVGGKTMFNIHIFDYANNVKYKSLLSQAGNTNSGNSLEVGNWRSTSPITSINLNASSTSWGVGTVYTLYGIKAA